MQSYVKKIKIERLEKKLKTKLQCRKYKIMQVKPRKLTP